MRVKKAQSEERLKCSSLPKLDIITFDKIRKLTMAYLKVPIHPVPMNNMCRLPCHHTQVLEYISIPRLPSMASISNRDYQNPSITHLFNFAFPTLLAFVWPFICERGLPRLNHSYACRIFFAQISMLFLNTRNYSPATVW